MDTPVVSINIEVELARMGELPLPEIRSRYLVLAGHDLPKHMRTGLARIALGHLIQERAFGGLDRASKRKLDALAAGIVPKGTPKPKPRNKTLRAGTRLVRQWKGRMYEVTVVKGGFEWDSRKWGSLTEISRTITGTNWNGWVFFGLKKPQSKSPNPIASEPAEVSHA